MSIFALYAAYAIGSGLVIASLVILARVSFPCRIVQQHDEEQPLGDASLLGRDLK